MVQKDFLPGIAATCSRSNSRSLKKQVSMAKQTKITIETDSLLILRGRSFVRAWCPRCVAEVEMIAMEDIGVISNLDPPRWRNGSIPRSYIGCRQPMARRSPA